MTTTTSPAPLLDLAAIAPVLPEEATVSTDGELSIGGVSVTELAQTVGTPAYVFDETGLRRQIRRFVDGLRQRWPNSEVLFASKSMPTLAMYAIAESEGLSVDVAGEGELRMALTAGVTPSRIYLHGNAKSESELALAVANRIGAIMVDNFDDIARLSRLTADRGEDAAPQKLFIRVIPGVSPHTHESQVTGGNDSKFGLPLTQVAEAIAQIASHPGLELEGVHMHIGSQILETDPFARAVAAIRALGDFPAYDVGGGLGITYTPDEPAPSVESYLDTITEAARRHLPQGAKLLIEPGRSIVARAGVTLYTVNTVKHNAKTFVAIDGGMADNLDIALTQQKYEAYSATKLDQPLDTRADLVGRQCESGDLMRGDLDIADPQPGDLVVMAGTGAYSYTMANHYNGALTAPVVFCKDGQIRLAARRETYDDVMRLMQEALDQQW